MIIIEIIFEVIKYLVIFIGIHVGVYVLTGALYFYSSAFAAKDDTFIKCIKKSWRYAKEGKPWYKT